MLRFKKIINYLLFPNKKNNFRAKFLHHDFIFLKILIFISLFYSLSFLSKSFSGFVLGVSSNLSADEIIQLVNEERQKQGLDPLKVNSKLNDAALSKAYDMFDKQYWDHFAPDGKKPWDFITEAGFDYVYAGENLAKNFTSSDQVVKAWMDSPTHKANILNPKFTNIGLAIVSGKLNGYETTLVVEMFATPSDNTQIMDGKTLSSAVDSVQHSLSDVSEEVAKSSIAIKQDSIVLNPVVLGKSFFILILFLILFALIYDGFVFNDKNKVRIIGHNLSHILFISTIFYLVILFKSGIVK